MCFDLGCNVFELVMRELFVCLIVKDIMLSRCGHVSEDHWNDIPQPSNEIELVNFY